MKANDEEIIQEPEYKYVININTSVFKQNPLLGGCNESDGQYRKPQGNKFKL